jgi:hypothetical protein
MKIEVYSDADAVGIPPSPPVQVWINRILEASLDSEAGRTLTKTQLHVYCVLHVYYVIGAGL